MFSVVNWAEGHQDPHFHAGPPSHWQAYGIPVVLSSGQGEGSRPDEAGIGPGSAPAMDNMGFRHALRFGAGIQGTALESGFRILGCLWGRALVCSGCD